MGGNNDSAHRALAALCCREGVEGQPHMLLTQGTLMRKAVEPFDMLPRECVVLLLQNALQRLPQDPAAMW